MKKKKSKTEVRKIVPAAKTAKEEKKREKVEQATTVNVRHAIHGSSAVQNRAGVKIISGRTVEIPSKPVTRIMRGNR